MFTSQQGVAFNHEQTPQLDHAQACCIRVTADTGVKRIPPVACLKPTGSNVITLLDALLNHECWAVYTVINTCTLHARTSGNMNRYMHVNRRESYLTH